MAIKFEKIQAGMTLWSRAKVQQGNVKGLKRMGEWSVHVKEVDALNRRATVSWNGNVPEVWGEYRLTRLFTKRMVSK